MTTALLIAPLLLSFTFLVSGAAKLRGRRATADAMVSLRLPLHGLHAAAAAALPMAEIVLAAALWIPVGAVAIPAAVLASLLSIAYLAIIGRALGFEETVECSCFGTLGSPTVSRATLGRDIILVLLSLTTVVLAATGEIETSVLREPETVAVLAIAVAVAVVLTALTLGVSRRDDAAAAPRSSAESPAADGFAADGDPGDEAEELDYLRSDTPFGMLREAGKEPITLSTLTRERAALLLWVSPGCGPCERVMSEVAAWTEQLGTVVAIRTLFKQAPEDLPQGVLDRVGDTAAQDIDRNLTQAFNARHSPSAVLLGADGMLAGGPVRGAQDVFIFVEEILEQLRDAGLQDAGDAADAKRATGDGASTLGT